MSQQQIIMNLPLSLPNLSDEAAFELFCFFEQLTVAIESFYFAQIQRHTNDAESSYEENAPPFNDEVPF